MEAMTDPCPHPYPALKDKDKEDLLSAIKRHYLRFGFRVAISRSRTRPNGDIYRVDVGCDRSGRAPPNRGIRKARSVKTGCLWTGALVLTGEEWTYVPGRNFHNHPAPLLKEKTPKETAKERAEALAKKRASQRARVRAVLPNLNLGVWRPGPKNSLTDVPGVLVSVQSVQPNEQVNTGVTIILPRKEWLTEACYANIFRFNGAGEMTGAHWIQESGLLNSPIVLTNPFSVGDAHRGVYEWAIRHHVEEGGELQNLFIPVVAETYDGYLSDICKMPIKPQDITRGIDLCTDEAVPEGNTGGGTGMICHHWKGGTGSSSRVIPGKDAEGDETSYTVGVLVQANYGKAQHLRIGGAPVGQILHDEGAHERLIQLEMEEIQREEEERAQKEEQRRRRHFEAMQRAAAPPVIPGIDQAFAEAQQLAARLQNPSAAAAAEAQLQAHMQWQASVAAHKNQKDGSIIVVLATDAPLSSAQCERLARRATVGMSRVGGYGHNMSGDIFIAFSTANRITMAPVKMEGPQVNDPYKPKALSVETIDPGTVDGLFEAAADATEEAIYNSMFMAQSIEGFKGRKVQALPLGRIQDIMRKYL